MTVAIPAEMHTLLSLLHRGGRYGYWWSAPDKRSFWWQVGKPGQIPAGERNIYFGVHPTAVVPPLDRHNKPALPHLVRSQIRYIEAASCFFGEYDAKDYGGDKEAALAALESVHPAPSAVIESGNGYHCYWLFDQPWIINTDEQRLQAGTLQARWVSYVGSDPASKDLARVLRPAGTCNYKYDPPRPVTMLRFDPTLLYPRDVLIDILPEEERVSTPYTNGSTPGHTSATEDDQRWAARKLGTAVSRLALAEDGKKSETLFNVSRLLGGLVPGGYLSVREIETALYAAIADRALDRQNALDTIRNGISYGEKNPITPEVDRRNWSERNGHTQTASEPSSEPDKLNLTDLGNARRLIIQHGRDIRYVPLWGSWLTWDQKRWTKDETGAVQRLARDTIGALYQSALQHKEPDERSRLVKWALRSESRKSLEDMVKVAQAEAGIPVRHDELDSDPYLFNCTNGTLDLRNGSLRNHERADLITKCASVAYDPASTCPTWLSFLNTIMDGDQEMVAFLQRAVGYTMIGTTSEQCLLFMYGTGKNGKSTFTETLLTLFGDYQQKAPTEMLMAKTMQGGIPNDIARLQGARLVVASEIAEGRRLAESLVKDLTGSDTIVARFLRQEYFQFIPSHTIWMYGNHKPIIRGSDEGIWRRLYTIPFEVYISPEMRDLGLKDRLCQELSGILAWALAGCLAWQQSGLQPPQKVLQATNTYREEMDLIGNFLDDCCLIGTQYHVNATALYESYKSWASDAGETPLRQRRFGMQLTERGFERKRSTGGRWRWFGLGLLAPSDPSDSGISAPTTAHPIKNSDPSDPSDPETIVPPIEGHVEGYMFLGSLGSLGSLSKEKEQNPNSVATAAPPPLTATSDLDARWDALSLADEGNLNAAYSWADRHIQDPGLRRATMEEIERKGGSR